MRRILLCLFASMLGAALTPLMLSGHTGLGVPATAAPSRTRATAAPSAGLDPLRASSVTQRAGIHSLPLRAHADDRMHTKQHGSTTPMSILVLVDAMGQPAAGIPVLLWRGTTAPVHRHTDARGELALGLWQPTPARPVRLRIDLPGVELEAQHVGASMRLRLPPMGAVRVGIDKAVETGRRGHRVVLRMGTTNRTWSATTNRDGQARFRIAVGAPAAQLLCDVGATQLNARVRAPAHEGEVVDAELEAWGTLRGRLQTPLGPIASRRAKLRIVAAHAQGGERTVTVDLQTDVEGRFAAIAPKILRDTRLVRCTADVGSGSQAMWGRFDEVHEPIAGGPVDLGAANLRLGILVMAGTIQPANAFAVLCAQEFRNGTWQALPSASVVRSPAGGFAVHGAPTDRAIRLAVRSPFHEPLDTPAMQCGAAGLHLELRERSEP